jgi:AmmeMemoRadiSam system protein A
MDQNGEQPRAQADPVIPRRRSWPRFLLGAIAVFVVWFFFVRPTSIELSQAQQDQLLRLAREQLELTVSGGESIDLYLPDLPDRLLREGSAFVSLTEDGVLRGCMIDQFQPHEPLVLNVIRNVQLAARSDARFAPIGPDELESVRIKISIVFDIAPLQYNSPDDLLDQLSPHLDGVILSFGDELATYLPSVWDIFPDPAQFLSELCLKAGWDADRWETEPYLTVQTYSAYEFGEP